jgi:sugar lactone lactonase YvrE
LAAGRAASAAAVVRGHVTRSAAMNDGPGSDARNDNVNQNAGSQQASSTPECVWPVGAQLGEGPIWSAAEEAIWFVDIKGKRIHRFHEPTGKTQSFTAPSEPGFIAPTSDGTFIAGLKTGLHRFNPKTGEFQLLAKVEPNARNNRLNDGYVDSTGYLWFGSMDDDEKDPTGALYQLTDSGSRQRDSGYIITNGPTASPDNRTLYHTDTLKKIVYAFDRAPDGMLSNRRIFTRIGEGDGHPDGPITDSQGYVWSGLFGGWGVNRYAPDGRKVSKLVMPVANVTKAAFGGKDLRTLYITTAWKGLSDKERKEQPNAGGLFRVRVDVAGLPQGIISHGL